MTPTPTPPPPAPRTPERLEELVGQQTEKPRRSSARGPRNRAELAANAEKVIAAMRARGGTASIVELRDDVGFAGHQPVLGALRFLEADGRVRKGPGKAWTVVNRGGNTSPAEIAAPAPDAAPSGPLDRSKLVELVASYGPITGPDIVARLPWAVSSALDSHLPVYQMLASLADDGLVKKGRGGRWESVE